MGDGEVAGGHVDIVQKDTSSQIGSDVSNNGSESATPASATTGPQRGVDTLTKGQPPPGPTGSTSAVRGAQQNGAVPTVPGMVSKQAIIENLIKTKGVSWMGAGVGERAGKPSTAVAPAPALAPVTTAPHNDKVSMLHSHQIHQIPAIQGKDDSKRQDLTPAVHYGFTNEQLMCLRAQILIYRRTRRAMQSGEKLTVPSELISIAGCKPHASRSANGAVYSTMGRASAATANTSGGHGHVTYNGSTAINSNLSATSGQGQDSQQKGVSQVCLTSGPSCQQQPASKIQSAVSMYNNNNSNNVHLQKSSQATTTTPAMHTKRQRLDSFKSTNNNNGSSFAHMARQQAESLRAKQAAELALAKQRDEGAAARIASEATKAQKLFRARQEAAERQMQAKKLQQQALEARKLVIEQQQALQAKQALQSKHVMQAKQHAAKNLSRILKQSFAVTRPLFEATAASTPPVISTTTATTASPSSVGHEHENIHMRLGYDVFRLLETERERSIARLIRKRNSDLQQKLAILDKNGSSSLSSEHMSLMCNIKKMNLIDMQRKLRQNLIEEQKQIMILPDRKYKRFAKWGNRQIQNMKRIVAKNQTLAVLAMIKETQETQRRLVSRSYADRDKRILRNKAVLRFHERLDREIKKKKAENQKRRLEAVKANNAESYLEMLAKEGAAGDRYEQIEAFLKEEEEEEEDAVRQVFIMAAAIGDKNNNDNDSNTGRRLMVLYGSETGNAEAAAERVVRECEARGYAHQVILLPMNKYHPSQLLHENEVIMVASTAGQGEPPKSMVQFWRILLRRSLPDNALVGLRVAVFGLGDSGYQHYNSVAKKLFRRLMQLGATAITNLGLGDDQVEGGYDVALGSWIQQGLCSGLGLHVMNAPLDPNSFALLGKIKVFVRRDGEVHDPTSSNALNQEHKEGLGCVWTIQEAVDAAWSYKDMKKEVEHVDGILGIEKNFGTSPAMSGTRLDDISDRRPFEASIVDIRELTNNMLDRKVIHVAFSTKGTQLCFNPGDLVSVLPRQDPCDVETLCNRLGFNVTDIVSLSTDTATTEPEHSLKTCKRIMLGPLIDGLIDINSGSPSRFFFQMLSHFTKSETEKDRLIYFATEGREDLFRYNERERRTLIEVLADFPEATPPLEWFLQTAPKLKPRQFSISSSLSVHREEIHITAAIVNVKTPYKRSRKGLCTSYLEAQSVGDLVPIWIEKGSIHMPTGDVPLILVGPGTGVAPFRSFIQESLGPLAKSAHLFSQNSNGVHKRDITLFFGCRNRLGDYLYGEEWEMRSQSGDLHVHTAFSRDNPHRKHYVTHCIRDDAERIWRLVSNHNAHIFVSGSSTKMPEDVCNAFIDVAKSRGNLTDGEAKEWMRKLEHDGRYHVESWS